jgi:hypothetical protein
MPIKIIKVIDATKIQAETTKKMRFFLIIPTIKQMAAMTAKIKKMTANIKEPVVANVSGISFHSFSLSI